MGYTLRALCATGNFRRPRKLAIRRYRDYKANVPIRVNFLVYVKLLALAHYYLAVKGHS